MKWSSLLAPALAAVTVQAQLATFDTNQGPQYALSIPSSTASSGRGDIFFQLKGPSSLQWIAIGFGSQMAGSMIFVMYADGKGNVTVSPRQGLGSFMPNFWSQPKIELLAGTGIVGGKMVANVKCSNCESWQGGSLDFSSTKQNFIWAQRSGPPLNSESEQQVIQQHQQNGQTFTFNMPAAAGGNPVNPFTPQAVASEVPSSPKASQAAGSSSGTVASPLTNVPMLLKAHGTVMGLVFVILLPFGALTLRVFKFNGVIWAHAASQILSLTLFTGAFAIGVFMARDLGILYKGAGTTHTVFGTVILALLWLQPLLGFAHHAMFVKHRSRTGVSHAHIWYGRALFVLGVTNGGIGLKLTGNTDGGLVAYGVVAGFVGTLYVAVVVWSERKRSRDRRRESESQSPSPSPSEK